MSTLRSIPSSVPVADVKEILALEDALGWGLGKRWNESLADAAHRVLHGADCAAKAIAVELVAEGESIDRMRRAADVARRVAETMGLKVRP